MARMLFDIVRRFLTSWDQHAVALGPATIATIDFLENLSGSLSLLLREFEQVEVDAFGRATETGDSSRHDGMVGERGTSSAYFYSCTVKEYSRRIEGPERDICLGPIDSRTTHDFGGLLSPFALFTPSTLFNTVLVQKGRCP